MTWHVVDTAVAARSPSRFVAADIPSLPDHVDYEEIVGRAFSDPSSRDFLLSGGVVVIACGEETLAELRRLGDRAHLLRREGVESELRRIGLERRAVALQWRP